MKAAAFRRTNTRLIWIAVGLCLAFFALRLIAIDHFPPFLDEMQHVQEAEFSRAISPFMYTGEGRLLTIWWYMLFQPDLTAPVWLARAATLLVVLPGFAAVLAVGNLVAKERGAVFAGLAYLFSTSNFFFERMALADPISASAVLAAIYFACRLSRRVNDRDAVLTGIALFIAVSAKATALPFLGIPIAAALALRPAGRTMRANLRWLGIALGSGAGLVTLFALGLRVPGYTPFGFIELYNSQASRPILERTLAHAQQFGEWFSTYTGVLVFVLLIIALIGLVVRRQFYLVLCLLGPALIFWINERQYTRYFVALTAVFLLIGGVFLAQSVAERRRTVQIAALIGLLAWGVVQWLPFVVTSYADPASLPLPARDYAEYVSLDASGFGLPEIRDILQQQQPDEVIGVLANCHALRYLALGQFKVTCPKLNPSGQDIGNIERLIETSRRPGVYVVFEPLAYTPERISGTLIDTVTRPGNSSELSIYHLTP